MKRIPRKLKKIAKKAVQYGSTDFFMFLNLYAQGNMPKCGIWFYIPGNMKSNKKGHFVVKFGKKVREAYYNGFFDF